MRTLVISDLHLGMRSGHDVLRRPAALRALLEELKGTDRLVLLGDTVELLEGRPKAAMQAALPVLRAIGAGLGRGREVVVVLGNHDHALVRPWLRAERAAGRTVGLDARVPAASSRALAAVVDALRPATAQVRYPGVWLDDGVWATHGHYLDRHLIPTGGQGLLLRRIPDRGARPLDYEQRSGASAAAVQGRLAAALPPALGEPLDRFAGSLRRASTGILPLAARALGTDAVAPAAATALGFQFRRAGLPAMAEVVARLDVPAEHVIFGHLHRVGPREGDDLAEWHADRGRGDAATEVAFTNSGCWVYEPLLLAGGGAPHPYWPGGAVVLEDGRPPRAVGLLDGVDDALVRGRRTQSPS